MKTASAFILASFLSTAFLSGPAAAGTAEEVTRADLRAGCNHYENRARFLPRTGDIAFEVLIAEMCGAAETSLKSTNAVERQAAQDLLERVLELRDTIIDMNMHRVYGDQTSPFARPVIADGRANGPRGGAFARVSSVGEYLIAHRMGLFTAFDAWLDTGPQFSLAFLRR